MKIIILLLTITTISHANNIELSAMSFLSDKKLFRGALIWPKPNAGIGISAKFWNKLHWRGPLLDYYVFEKKDPIKLDFGLRYMNDDDPMIKLSSHEEDFRNKRSDALDFLVHFQYKFGWRKFFAAGIKVHQELIRHTGQYFNLYAEAPVAPFTKLAFAVGLNSLDAAAYAYGPTAEGGVGHLDLAIKNVMTKLPFSGIIINQIGSSWITQGENKQADYIRGDAHHYYINTRVIWKFFP